MHFPNLLEEVSEQRVYPPVLYLAVLHQGPQHQQESQVEGNHQKSTRPIVVAGKPRKRPTAMANPSTQSAISGSMPTLLNGSGDSISISSGAGARGSDGLLSLPSPPQSRSSSAQDSYSTSVTTTEELGDGFRGREGPDDADKRSSKPAEGKGNVIVSVRVRPDANSQGETSRSDGEWVVDGRKSLVAYRGKEGGDYYYGKAMFDNFFKLRLLIQ